MEATGNGGGEDRASGVGELALERERALRRELEEEVTRLRRSEAFRVGHALVSIGRMRRGLLRWRRGGQPDEPPPPLAPSPPPAPPRPAEEKRSKKRSRSSDDTVVVVSLGAEHEDVAAASRTLDQALSMLAEFKAVVVSDASAFRRLDHSFAIEHVIPLDHWTQFRPAADWGAYATKRVADVIADYRSSKVVVLSPIAGSGALFAVLPPIVVPSMAYSEANLIDD